MATAKQNKNQANAAASSTSTWRKPISLALFNDEDPLEQLYRGREAREAVVGDEKPAEAVTAQKAAKSVVKKAAPLDLKTAAVDKPKRVVIKQAQKIVDVTVETEEDAADDSDLIVVQPLTEDELKKILRIKNEFFRFSDIQEILRGKSLDIYSYLRLLAGETGFCKIRHLDLMRKLDISRPTLFKQEEWLMRLRLIEKRNVPGDHLGTSYTVYRLEEVLPVPRALVKQLNVHVESLNKNL